MIIKLKDGSFRKENYLFRCPLLVECRGVALTENNQLEIKCHICGVGNCFDCCLLCKKQDSICYKEINGLNVPGKDMNASKKLMLICQLEELKKFIIDENKIKNPDR